MGALMENVKSAKVSPSEVAIWWIGQAGYIIKTSEDKVIFIDAFLSEELLELGIKQDSICEVNVGDFVSLMMLKLGVPSAFPRTIPS